MKHTCNLCDQEVELKNNLHPYSLQPGNEAEYGQTWTVNHFGCQCQEDGEELPEGDGYWEAWVNQWAA